MNCIMKKKLALTGLPKRFKIETNSNNIVITSEYFCLFFAYLCILQ